MANSVSQNVRVVKFKTGEFDFKSDVDLKEMLNELKPKHDQLIEIVLTKK